MVVDLWNIDRLEFLAHRKRKHQIPLEPIIVGKLQPDARIKHARLTIAIDGSQRILSAVANIRKDEGLGDILEGHATPNAKIKQTWTVENPVDAKISAIVGREQARLVSADTGGTRKRKAHDG